MDITNMLNSNRPAAVAAAAERQYHQQLAHVNTNMSTTMRNTTGYPSPSELQQPMSMLRSGYEERSYDSICAQKSSPSPSKYQSGSQGDNTVNQTPTSNGNAKTFPCATCGKGFARRSDLARHERIHTGDRPHVCSEPGCGKQFIQRSALTVHMRVHSGEKPHMCERCGKPFSDSSSLARHRRIHSGNRPYKCPFADCQKTFTRRTTLTRHQNHHSGTVEEAAVATAAALATRAPGVHRRTGSDGGNFSDTASNFSGATRTPSPGESLSPQSDVPHMPHLNRQTSSLSYNSSDSLPLHMRNGLQQPSPRSSPSASSPSLSAFGGSSNYHRPSLTSHPNLPVLEPPTYHDLRQPGSGSGSPHLSSSWPSPVHPNLPSPSSNEFMYPDAPFSGPGMSHYQMHPNARRTHSTEPDQYDSRRRLPSWASTIT